MKELLYKLLYSNTEAISPSTILSNMGVALVLGVVIYITYKITFSGVIYSKKFNVSLIMLTMVTSMVMNIIGSSVALSLGMVGALSIVRFRTAIKDPRDTAYIFWAIAVGLGTGTSNYFIVVIGALCVSAICILLSFGVKNDDSFFIIIRCNDTSSSKVRTVLFNTYRACKLRSETIVDSYTEMVYQVKITSKKELGKYENIKKIEGVSFVNIVAQNGETLG